MEWASIREGLNGVYQQKLWVFLLDPFPKRPIGFSQVLIQKLGMFPVTCPCNYLPSNFIGLVYFGGTI